MNDNPNGRDKLQESEGLLRLVEDYVWDILDMCPEQLQVKFEDTSIGMVFCERSKNTWHSIDIPYLSLLRYCLRREDCLLDAQFVINEVKGD